MKIASRFEAFPPYTPIEPFEVLSEHLGRKPEEIVKLNANENPYGPSPLALKALAKIPFPHIYPDPESRCLRAALADFTGAPFDNLLAGAGADELIDLILRIMLEPQDTVINCPPTFGMYSFNTNLNAGRVISVPRNDDFTLDVPAIIEAVETYNPKVLFLTSPNNPDGSMIAAEEFEALITLPVLVVLDEAYIEFSGGAGQLGEKQSRIQRVTELDNLIILRTFSKWAGLAGLRVGYGAFPTWIMPTLWKAKQPYNVNVAANVAALASLQDLDHLVWNVARIRAERDRLYERLKSIPCLHPFPSQANFILCQVIGRNAVNLKNTLLERGILVRYYDTPRLKNFIRISIGRPQDNQVIFDALKEITGERIAS